MNRNELKELIRETIQETMEQVVPLGVAESCFPEDMPDRLKEAIMEKYGDKACEIAKKLEEAKNAGNKRVCEMWLSPSESLSEKLDPHADASVWINDFQNSKDPRFKGKSQEKRKEMALAAYYTARRGAGLKTEDYDPDQQERDDYNGQIDRHNRKNPQRFECPTCKTPDALSAWEKKKGYQCQSCADTEEGLYEEEGGDGSVDHDETDLSNPEENREVELANQIKKLAQDILSMHGVEGDEKKDGGEEADEESEETNK